MTWLLNEIKSITCLKENFKSSSGSTTLVYALELIFRNDTNNQTDANSRYVWKCENETDRNKFVNTLFKLAEEYLKASDRPKFNNFNFEGKFNK